MSIEFAIEWAYGEFRIARMRGPEVLQSWKSPTSVNDLNDLSAALAAAADVVELGRGGSVAIAYEDDLHTHEFLELPPMSRRDRVRYLQRYVDNNKPFDGAAEWRAHPVKRNRVNGVLLHLMPKYICDGLMRVCAEFYLVPKIFVPLTEIMSRFVPSLEREEDNAILLLALFDNRTQMLISDDNGEILFVRELSYPWTAETNGRLVLDINRTIGYSKQRIGGMISEAWILGPNAAEVSDALTDRIDAKVQYNAAAAKPAFWMQQVVSLPVSLHSNFVSLLARGSISGKTVVRAGLLVTSILLLAAFGVGATVEYAIWRHQPDVASLTTQIEERRQEIQLLQMDVARMDAEAKKLDILNLNAFNLPGLFLSRLWEIVPSGLIVTEVRIAKTGEFWSVDLEGRSNETLGAIAPLLVKLETNLSSAPWNAEIVQSWETAWMQQLEQGLAANGSEVGFLVRGQLQ
ncbi:MAG: hypothetical protein AAGL69_00135 [Pseudomonadota bacterium]